MSLSSRSSVWVPLVDTLWEGRNAGAKVRQAVCGGCREERYELHCITFLSQKDSLCVSHAMAESWRVHGELRYTFPCLSLFGGVLGVWGLLPSASCPRPHHLCCASVSRCPGQAFCILSVFILSFSAVDVFWAHLTRSVVKCSCFIILASRSLTFSVASQRVRSAVSQAPSHSCRGEGAEPSGESSPASQITRSWFLSKSKSTSDCLQRTEIETELCVCVMGSVCGFGWTFILDY